jgi:hypothetical protein
MKGSKVMQNEEKIIQTIRKVLELSRNNTSEGEARVAALKAQELLAKYHIDMKEVESIDIDAVESIEEVRVDLPAKKWKYKLAQIVADNFRCKHFYIGKGILVFYGHKTDADVAAETFKYLFNVGNRLAGREVDKAFIETGTSANVYNSFVAGFCAGIEEGLAQQCKALMIITPEDVKTSFAEMTKSWGTMNCGSMRIGANAHCKEAYETGKTEGRHAVRSRQIEN